MIATRNTAVHVYHEELADRLHGALPGFLKGFEELHRSLGKLH